MSAENGKHGTAEVTEETKAAADANAQRTVADRARSALQQVQEETERRMKDLMERGESYGKESLQTLLDRLAPAVRLSESLVTMAKENRESLVSRAKENAEWIQEKVEEAVNRTLGAMHLPTPQDFASLQESVQTLSKKVEALGKLTEAKDTAETAVIEVDELREQIDGLRGTVDNLGKNLGLLENKVRKSATAKNAAPRKGGRD